jgi:NCS1 nucleoside transporter family
MPSSDLEEKGEKPYISVDDLDPELPPNLQAVAHKGFFGTLRHYELLLDEKLGIEAHGPARILPEMRDPAFGKWNKQIVMALMWASGTMNLSCFTTGFLGWELGLSLSQTIWITVVASFVGSAVTVSESPFCMYRSKNSVLIHAIQGWCATMGPSTGLRQVSICRYAMGWWPAKIIAFLNVIEQVGWSSVGCITGGLALSAVSNGHINLVLGVVIVAIVGMVFSVVGLRAVLAYEKYAWAVFFVIFMVMYGELAPQASLSSPPTVTGATNKGFALTLFAVVYGSSASWCSIVSDYYVQYPVNTSKTKIFLLTTCGIAIPTCIGMICGCCVGSTMGVNADWANTYTNDGVGELLQTILFPRGFAKFLLVLLVLSGIGTNCIAMYSGALSVQQFAQPLSIVPRFIWTFLVFVAIILIGIAGRNHLLDVLQNFLSLLGYWNTSLFVILFVEHYWFRDGWHGFKNYDLEAWNTASRMPIGFAGFAGFAAGIAGAVVGMDETWWVGPIARKIGLDGGDVGNELSLVFTLVAFVPVRYLELKYIGR